MCGESNNLNRGNVAEFEGKDSFGLITEVIWERRKVRAYFLDGDKGVEDDIDEIPISRIVRIVIDPREIRSFLSELDRKIGIF